MIACIIFPIELRLGKVKGALNKVIKMAGKSLIYGTIVFVAIFFVGWVTGMGGSFLPNLFFSILMGAFAAICFVVVTKFGK